MKRPVLIDLLLLAAIWILAALAVNPRGDFPLIDDWGYGKVVRHLLQEGVYKPTRYPQMTLISQVLWGTLFCLPAGFSFTALRISTLVLSFIGVGGGYLLVMQMGRSRWIAILVALTCAFNPIYFGLSYTFMTDVPFAALSCLALLMFTVVLQTDSDRYWILGVCLATIAVLCRQVGLFIPIAFGLTYLAKHGPSRRAIVRATIPCLAGIVAFLALSIWRWAAGCLPMSDSFMPPAGKALVMQMIHQTPLVLLYLGTFLFPLLLVVFPRVITDQTAGKRRIRWAVLLCAVLASAGIAYLSRCEFPSNLVLSSAGVGPRMLRDTRILHMPHVAPLNAWFWRLVCSAGILGSGMLVATVLSNSVRLIASLRTSEPNEEKSDAVAGLLFLSGCVVYLLPVVMSATFYDRYLVPILLPAALAVLLSVPRNRPSSNWLLLGNAFGIAGCVLVFSVVGTHDWLQYNRARWIATRFLMEEKHVAPSQIDGGSEFDGLYLYETMEEQERAGAAVDERKSKGDAPKSAMEEKSFWWVQDDEYVIALGEIPGYDTMRKVEFTSWLPPTRASIFILHRIEKISQREPGAP